MCQERVCACKQHGAIWDLCSFQMQVLRAVLPFKKELDELSKSRAEMRRSHACVQEWRASHAMTPTTCTT